ncbi:MAG: cytochrome c family protein [Methylobacterium sp.]|nr:cytochrome c family protein [Methylobacterium sp.]MCA3604886.1 cytochrome c family protein [Methylobacterium sp.]MCA3608688.1 cytochrome c family protein [Methylobacterium sp.]MCA3616548.1 cytochrome c family protein [Methylobacterium sp.]MCA3620482.1 cytochrome c family protein [Methylobacterium sp.]
MKRNAMLRAFALSALVLLPAASALAQDAEAGKSVFNQCRACHQVGETARNGAGPVLNGLFGRKAGTVTGYSYSEANKNSGIIWDETNFAAYIKDPKGFMPGNKMAYAGLKDDKRIADLIAYLKTFGPDGKPK